MRRLLLLLLVLPACKGTPTAPATPAAESAKAVHAPALTAERMPAGLSGLVLGVSAEAAVAGLAPAAVRLADKSLGGDGVVLTNDLPSIRLTWVAKSLVERRTAHDGIPAEVAARAVADTKNLLPGEGALAAYEQVEATLVKTAGSDAPVLDGLTVTAPAATKLCAWLDSTFGGDPESTRCPGTNRTFGKDERGMSYCLGDAGGEHNVFASCGAGSGWLAGTETLELSVAH